MPAHLQTVNFVVVDCSSVYNVIIEHPTLNIIQAITSTFHLLVKFPTFEGIGVLEGQHAQSRELYKVENRPSNIN